MKQPLITFIVTYYNLPPQFLHDCIESILALSLQKEEREIIVIDDGSSVSPTDALKDLIDEIIYIRQPNSGLSISRNFGIEACRGEFIQFIDGDDKLNSSVYNHCLDLVRDNDPDIVTFFLSNKEEQDTGFEYEGPIEGAEYMRKNNLRASACGYIFRKKTLLHLRFTSGILHEDEEFTPQLFLRAEKVFTTKLFRLTDMADTLSVAERAALQRRIDQLTMDYIYNIITLTHNGKYLEQCIEELKQKGLFPLPDKDYTQKYKWFRRLSSTRQGRRMLCMLLR